MHMGNCTETEKKNCNESNETNNINKQIINNCNIYPQKKTQKKQQAENVLLQIIIFDCAIFLHKMQKKTHEKNGDNILPALHTFESQCPNKTPVCAAIIKDRKGGKGEAGRCWGGGETVRTTTDS